MKTNTENVTIDEAATGNEIVALLRTFTVADRAAHNWGNSPRETGWRIPGTCTYINGIMLTIDCDYESAHLLEICDQRPNQTWVTHLAVEIRHTSIHAWSWLKHRPYPFFQRPAGLIDYDLYSEFLDWYECNQEDRPN